MLVANYESDVGFAWWLMENFWVELSVLFGRRGGRAFLAYPVINEIPQKIRDSSITVLRHDFEDRSWTNLMSLKRIVKDNNVAHVYLTDKRSQDMRYAALRSWGVKTIVTHDHSYRPARSPSIIRRSLNSLRHQIQPISCDHYIAVSKYIVERIVRDGGVSPDKVSCVLNGIEPIESDPENRHYAHDMFGFPRGALIVVSTGRAALSKGIGLLIECAKTIIDAGNSNLYFLHCGVGPDLTKFKSMVKTHGLEHRFVFAGKRSDIRQILPSCHIGIQLSQGEAFSLALLEYLGSGLATLASDVGGNPEAICSGRNGILFPPNDLTFIVNAIQELERNQQHRNELGAAARESVRTSFNIQRANREFIALYEGILARHA